MNVIIHLYQQGNGIFFVTESVSINGIKKILKKQSILYLYATLAVKKQN